ncbi:MAG: AlkA N-terminal domain-containing protein [Planctomycetota bacterium]
MILDADICYRAVQTRDPRFDGRFFSAVKTTGIYCRPLCPARTPRRENMEFYPSAAAAQEAGFRPCLRCRPEVAPGSPAGCGTAATVTRALRLIENGALDTGDVPALALRLGIGERHLRRLFLEHLGVGPQGVAQTRRILLARTLLEQSELTMTGVALAAGFSSVRRFNGAMRSTYGCAPGELRRRRHRRARSRLKARLAFRPPFDWEGLLAFLAPRALPGVERIDRGRYERTARFDESIGRISVCRSKTKDELDVEIDAELSPYLSTILARLRRLFDLRADSEEIDAHLASDPALAKKLRSGRRVPGTFDPFELAVRAVLGQQVSVAGATTLAGRLVRELGQRIADTDELSHLSPTPEDVSQADLSSIGLTGARQRTLRALASATLDGELDLEASPDLDGVVDRLTALPGIGDWTAQYIAMRGYGETDAFPAGDLALRRALGREMSAAALRRRAETWRPWRAYAAMTLWQGMSK